jgi:DNA polymerase elongation subunit (family B)
VYDGYLLFLKKNYAGIKCLPSKHGFSRTMDFKGIDPVRRDRSKLVREVCTDVLVCLLEQRSTEAAKQKLLEALESIKSRPMEDFVLSKSIKTSYTSNAPHNLARERMIARGDADIPPVGSRMPFIIVAEKVGVNKKNTSKIYSRSDHPTHVKKNNLQIDYAYYMESLQNPMLKLLQFTDLDVKSIFSLALGKAEVERKGFKSLLQQSNEKKQRCIEF